MDTQLNNKESGNHNVPDRTGLGLAEPDPSVHIIEGLGDCDTRRIKVHPLPAKRRRPSPTETPVRKDMYQWAVVLDADRQRLNQSSMAATDRPVRRR
jgi:hypothetical protein